MRSNLSRRSLLRRVECREWKLESVIEEVIRRKKKRGVDFG